MANQQAGWYPDPSGDTSKLRYWDGTNWTNDFTDVPQGAAPQAAQPVPQAQPAAPIPVQPQPQGGVQQTTSYTYPGGGQTGAGQAYTQPPAQKTNGTAIAALICGIVGLCIPLVAVAAIITGATGRKNPVNRGLATAGLVLGIVGVAFWVLWIILVFLGYGFYY